MPRSTKQPKSSKKPAATKGASPTSRGRTPLTYREIVARDGETLSKRAETVHFEHGTAKGDAREILLRETIAGRLGRSFSVEKGEVIDAAGARTGEFDLIIYDNRVTAAVAEDPLRKLIRVESVVAVIEVKSEYDRGAGSDDNRQLDAAMKKLSRLRRRFVATRQSLAAIAETHLIERLIEQEGDQLPPELRVRYQEIAESRAAWEDIFDEGLPAHDGFDLPTILGTDVVVRYHIPTFVFSFRGVGYKRIPARQPDWDYLCIQNEGLYLTNAADDGSPLKRIAQGEDAFPRFVHLLEMFLQSYLNSGDLLAPAWHLYHSPESDWSEAANVLDLMRRGREFRRKGAGRTPRLVGRTPKSS